MTADVDAPMTPARALQLWIAVQTLKPVRDPWVRPRRARPRARGHRRAAAGRSDPRQRQGQRRPEGPDGEPADEHGRPDGHRVRRQRRIHPPRHVAAGVDLRRPHAPQGGRIHRQELRRLGRAHPTGRAARTAPGERRTPCPRCWMRSATRTPRRSSWRRRRTWTPAASSRPRASGSTPMSRASTSSPRRPTSRIRRSGGTPRTSARLDFRYLNVSSTTVDEDGRVVSEFSRQSGLPEPYIILATLRSPDPDDRLPGEGAAAPSPPRGGAPRPREGRHPAIGGPGRGDRVVHHPAAVRPRDRGGARPGAGDVRRPEGRRERDPVGVPADGLDRWAEPVASPCAVHCLDSETVTPPRPDLAPRTYQVRTYGCQMNVHDSERLVRPAGGRRLRPGRRGRDRGCRGVQHLRRPRERRQPALRQPQPPRAGEGRPSRACRSPWVAASPRRTRATSSPRPPGSTSCSERTTSARCRSSSSVRASRRRPRSRSRSPSRCSPRRCRRSATAPTRRGCR